LNRSAEIEGGMEGRMGGGREGKSTLSLSQYDEIRANVGRNCEKQGRYEAMWKILLSGLILL
jgi:hypothetical protein